MGIDTKSVSQLISEFRKLQAKNAIALESMGYILQRLADPSYYLVEYKQLISNYFYIQSRMATQILFQVTLQKIGDGGGFRHSSENVVA